MNSSAVRSGSRNLLRRTAVSVLLLAAVFGAGRAAAETGTAVSTRRVELIRSTLREAAALLDPETQKAAIIARTEASVRKNAGIPPAPTQPSLTRDWAAQQARSTAAAAALAEIPEPDRAALQRQAEARYPLVRSGETVTATFQINPVRQETVTGVFRGRSGDYLVIGNRRFQEADLAAPAAADAPVLQFDEAACLKKRAAYVNRNVEDAAERRRQLQEKTEGPLLAKLNADRIRRNEENGYLWLYDSWVSMQAAIQALYLEELPSLRAISELHRGPAVTPPVTPALPVAAAGGTKTTATVALSTPTAAAIPTPAAMTAAAVTPTAAPTGAALTATTKTTSPSPTAPVPVKPAAVKPAAHVPAAATPAPAAGRKGASAPALAAAAAGILGFGGWLAWLLLAAGKRGKTGSRFITTAAAAAQELWKPIAGGAATPFVAVSFENYQAGLKALSRLSFLRQDPAGRELTSHLPLVMGLYADEGQVIAFVSGNALTFRYWTEADAVLRSAAGARESQRSSEPSPEIEFPETSQLPPEAAGVEPAPSRPNPADPYAAYELFTAPSQRAALAFLKTVRIGAPGIHAVVLTPDGHWGRDLDGIYRE